MVRLQSIPTEVKTIEAKKKIALKEALSLTEDLGRLVPVMVQRVVDKHEVYGSIYQYDANKFLANLAKNYAEFVQAVIYNDTSAIDLKTVDIIGVLLMIRRVMEST